MGCASAMSKRVLPLLSACTIFHEVNQGGVVREHGAFCRY